MFKIEHIKNAFSIFIGLITISMTILSCEKLELEKEVPNCVERKIRKIKKEKVQNPPATVWEWKINDNTYYYLTSDCCDQLNYLYNKNCEQICAPDGGITGGGDGDCPEFKGQIERNLIWKDDREK